MAFYYIYISKSKKLHQQKQTISLKIFTFVRVDLCIIIIHSIELLKSKNIK